MNWAAKSAAPPPGYAYGPAYRASLPTVIRALIYLARGRPRSLAHDALYAIADMPHPPTVRGHEHVPERGPFVLVANHYERPGLWMAWPAMLAGHLVRERSGADTRWIAIEEWESFSLFGIPIPRAAIRSVFERAFSVYGIVAMPPPEAPASARAAAMRTAAREVRGGAVLGLMPEGTVGPTPELLHAREGVGTFLLLLTSAGTPILPAGIYEEEERLVIHFGSSIDLTPPAGVAREERDRWARDQAMLAIRDLLPEPLWGAYRS